MALLLSNVKWGRTILAGITPHVVWNLMLVVSVTIGFQLDRYGPWNMLVLVPLLTLCVAVVVARSTRPDATLHGVLVGLTSALIGLTFGLFPLQFVVTVAAGWLGGWLVQRR